MKKRVLSIVLTVCMVFSLSAGLVTHIHASNQYVIRGVLVYYDMDLGSPPGGSWSGQCWEYAKRFYELVWKTSFTGSYFNDTNNMLRNLSRADLTITAEHLKEYISAAPLGSIIRVTPAEYFDKGDPDGHSMFLVDKDENGFRFFGTNSSKPDTGYREDRYFTWSEFASGYYGRTYDYIKYIKWPGAPEYDDVTYTININANGGTENVTSFSLDYGEDCVLSPDMVSRSGYTLAGWNLYRPADNKWFVAGEGWYTESEIAANDYGKCLYRTNLSMELDSSWFRRCAVTVDSFTFYAVWEACSHDWAAATYSDPKTCTICGATEGEPLAYDDVTYTININANGGTENVTSLSLDYGEDCVLSPDMVSRSGYTLAGWNLYRPADNKWFVAGEGWYTESEIAANDYGKCLYRTNLSMELDSSWFRRCAVKVDSFTFYAVWEACSHDWAAATCTTPKTCKICGATSGSALGHSWQDATCTTPKTCITCGATDGSALGHSWQNATCTAPKTCKTCGATDGSALGHSWQNATCTAPKTCKTCGATDGSALGHDWQNATCTAPKTCKTCGATDGSALGHSWQNATCTAPKTCKTCGATEGSALGHSWQDATCTAPKTCKTCGVTEGAALGHDWQDATSTTPKTCKRCGTTDGEALQEFTYSIANEQVTITGYNGTATEVVIPSQIEGYPVTAIGDYSFQSYRSMTTISIPASVTTIGNNAFAHCYGLTGIVIPDGVTSIGESAFYDCQGLLSIVLPGSVTSIRKMTFENCYNLTSITLLDGVTTVGERAFNGCHSLAHITIPNSVTSIGDKAFCDCSSLTSITLPDGVTDIANSAFYGCRSLSSFIIPSSVTSILGNAFNGCSALTSITIPSRVNALYGFAFANCSALKSIKFQGRAPKIFTANCFSGVTATAYYPADDASWTEAVRQNYGGTITWVAEGATHTHDWAAATCTAPKTCKTCGATEGSALGHSWQDATCTASKTCKTCGATEGSALGHSWQDATCTAPKTCKACGATEGSALGHSWQDATCTAPKTCKTCGATEGKSLGHQYSITSETETQIVYTCIRCPASYTESKVTTNAAISVSSASGRVGNTVELKLSLENNPGFMWLQFNVAFDTSKLELVSYADSKLFPGYMAQQLSDGSFNFIWEDSANAANLTGDGVLATLSFKILEGAEAGDELPITITYDPENIYDAAFENVTFAPRNGTVSVISFIYGDVNDDTTINGKDVGMLKQYVAGHSVSINTDAADVYYDHKINAKDSGLLKQAVAGKTVVLGPSLNGANAQKLVLQPQSATNAVGSEPTIVINSGSASVGDTADVTLELKNNSGFLWLQFNVAFDTSKLELTGSADSRLFPVYMAQQLPDGSYNFIWEDSANAANLTGDGVLATLTFKVLDGAAVGEVIPFTITYDPENIYDENFSNVTFAVENGGITVLPTICNHTSLTAVTANAPTCTETGNIAYWICDGCDTIFADADASQEITLADTVIAALGHDWQDATCTEPKTCKTCGATEGAALGHDWADATCTEPKTCKTCGATEGDALGHDWADATCTEPKTCKNCGATEGEALGHDWQDATCTEPKTCKNCGATEGEALGHDWADATCTEPKTCKTCGVTEGEALGHDWQDATCTEPKTCKTCGATEGEALGHDWQDATCTEPKTCKTCGATEGEALGHDWADATCTEPKTCKTCGATEGDALGHDWADATCTEPKTCKNCGATEGDALGHDWQDATCTTPKTCKTCGATEGEALGHDWQDATCTEPKTCKTCGATEGAALGHDWADATCTEPKTCGATEGEALGHDWADATCTEPKTCKTCGATEGEVLGHDWQDATCTEPKTCKTCGATEGDALGHDWQDATCTEPKTCKNCGATEGEALGHDWQDATCTEPKTCKTCGATEGEALGHDWKDATCTEPKTCKTCGAAEGDALGHDWADATCTEPKTCKTCGATEGDALGHDWQDATCTEPKTCKICGATEGEALGHDFSNNREYCRHGCGTKNPDYIPPQEPVTPVDPKPAKPTPAPVGPKPVTPAEPEQPILPENPFTDVSEGSFYHDAILWAVEKGIIVDVESGVFNPEQSCTRGDMVTFMWRTAGSPEPLGKENPFTDVAEGDYYYKAVLWAVENGITKGTSASTFSPFTTCTRSQTVTFLHRFAGCPEVSGTNPFVDVAEGSYYYHAVLWAVENGITKGTGAAAFSPEMLCSRGQIITFLHRCMEL